MMDFWRSAIRQQFHAAIDMLDNAIKACPDSVWFGRGRVAFWYLGVKGRSARQRLMVCQLSSPPLLSVLPALSPRR